MAKSEYVKQLDEIQADAHALLRPLGFRKLGRSHNRVTAQGLIQVVNFQMGEFPIRDYVIPGIRESSYGTFAVNLGVLLPCVHGLGRFPIPKSVHDGHCTIRDRIRNTNGTGCFIFSPEIVPATVVDLLKVQGLPFLRQFETYQDVLDYYNDHGDLPFQNQGRASLEAAVVAHELGDITTGKRLFDVAYASDHKGFRSYVAEIAARFGHAVS